MIGQRTQLRAGDLGTPEAVANAINGVLRDLYLRVEALEGAMPDVVSYTFTTHPTDAFLGFPMKFSLPENSTPAGISIRRAENLTDPTAVFVDALAVQDFSISGSTMSIRFIPGLKEATTYRLTIEVKHAV